MMKDNYFGDCKSVIEEFNDRSDYKEKVLKTQQDYYEQQLHAMNLFLKVKHSKQDQEFEQDKLEIEFNVRNFRSCLCVFLACLSITYYMWSLTCFWFLGANVYI